MHAVFTEIEKRLSEKTGSLDNICSHRHILILFYIYHLSVWLEYVYIMIKYRRQHVANFYSSWQSVHDYLKQYWPQKQTFFFHMVILLISLLIFNRTSFSADVAIKGLIQIIYQ